MHPLCNKQESNKLKVYTQAKSTNKFENNTYNITDPHPCLARDKIKNKLLFKCQITHTNIDAVKPTIQSI